MLIDFIKNVRHSEEDIFFAIKASSAPVVLWGAGEIAWCVFSYLKQHGINPLCFCDNNPNKQGTKYLGLPVYSYEALKENFKRSDSPYQIIVATGIQYKEPICSQLAQAHEKNPVWYLCGYEVCGEKISYQYICDHISFFEEAYSSLIDNYSKEAFINVLNAKLSGDFTLYKKIMSPMQYFDDDLVHLSETEVFLDVGAYKGHAIIEFFRKTKGKYEGIIALEPDQKTRSILLTNITENKIDNVEIHNMAAWNKQEILYFYDGREGGSRISEETNYLSSAHSLEVDSIDSILQGRRVTYIAMDIEGSEHNAILGAEQTIKKWKPKMAVSVYHRREDMFDLLLLLKSFVPDYKFFLRHYTDNQTETVLYAI